MSVPTITYENFEGDPFIDSISTDDATKGAYEILEWAYRTLVIPLFIHVVLVRKVWF